MKIINVLLFSLLAVTSTFAQDATIAYRDTNDMFNGKIETGTNAPLPPPSESFNFIKSYTLKIRWRTYLGEPLERYEFGWRRNNSYTINVDGEQRTIIEDSLGKYPDLLDRFYEIRPTRVDIKLEGTAGGRTKDEMGAFGVGKINIPGEGTVDFVSYNYIVKDDDLLIGVSGFPKMQWVDSAPETWNEFLNWKGGFKSFNMPTNEFKRLSREEQSKRIKDIKSIWKQINAISISGSIENIEWPELEMIDIIKTYDRYKNKKKEPSPQEKLEKALAKVDNTPEYTKNDDWGKLPTLQHAMPNIELKMVSSRMGIGKRTNILTNPSSGEEIKLKNNFTTEYDINFLEKNHSNIELKPNPVGILFNQFILFNFIGDRLLMNGKTFLDNSIYYEITDFNGERVFTKNLNELPNNIPLYNPDALYHIDKNGDVFYLAFNDAYNRFDPDKQIKNPFFKRTRDSYDTWIVPSNIYSKPETDTNYILDDGPFYFEKERVINLLEKDGSTLMLSVPAEINSTDRLFLFYDMNGNYKGYLRHIWTKDYFEKN